MKNILLSIATFASVLLFSNQSFSQPPDLGATSGFAFFTAAGAFTNVGASNIIGDIGTDVGLFTGFPPGFVTGQIHVADVVSAQANIDVHLAYSQLFAKTCTGVLSTTMGNGQILVPGVYCTGAASTLNGNLFLDAGNDSAAFFYIQIDGALATGTSANVVLLNGASIWNVFWQINGEFILGDSSIFRGTVIAKGAITLLEASTLYGRALSTAGAISIHNALVNPGITVLPVKIADINASNNGKINQINWNTETENPGTVYELQHSADGKNFTALSTIPANAQNHLYTYSDQFPFSGMNYYRLKVMEQSGYFMYSKIVTAFVKSSGQLTISAYPNPIKDRMNVFLTGNAGNGATISITDLSGKKLKQVIVTGNSVSENMSDLAPGIYLLKYSDKNMSQTIKINKQ